MFRIWISRSSSISIREQLSAQLLFGILSHRLESGEKLPSVRELARRVKIHPNRVSASYQDLVARGWLKRKAGSGVFVREIKADGNRSSIDSFTHAWMEEGLSRGFSIDQIAASVERAAAGFREQPDRRPIVVAHPDRAFARILAAEIEEATGFAVPSAAVEEVLKPEFDAHSILTTASVLGSFPQLGAGRCAVIPLKSIEEVIARVPRPKGPALLSIVSRSESILKWASLLTPSLDLEGTDLIARRPGEDGWKDGLAACDMIVADILAAREVAGRTVVLRLVAEPFFATVRRLVTGEKA